ncbi:hypothetical protein FHY55_19450 [Oceanicola sp. D3]|uniref:head-tail joining protein n=1 Tax=Oceanicola sp. D3 TaxID=2587163 RepID=UPI00112255F7|nr:hypothetical protein [Oceanicola sp. D3]QDC11275.1 hypothetical protein FHY55_19450 [Oceanicola sp. D3]
MIDLAADTAAIFADAQGFGEDVTYTPDGGAPVAVRAIPSRPDETIGFAGAELASDTTRILVPVSEVATPAKGDAFTVGGENYVVQGKPLRDEKRLWWRVDLRPA